MPNSPCIAVCTTDANDTCIGCGRTLEEIARYSTASSQERQEINEQAERRLLDMVFESL